MSNLIPVQRTNKNGVTSRRWVRPESAASNSAVNLPAPSSKSPVSEQRVEDFGIISSAVSKFLQEDRFIDLLRRGSNEELRVIAHALDEYKTDYAFKSEIAKNFSSQSRLVESVNYSVVYQHSLHPMEPSVLRSRLITEAINEAETYCRTVGDWNENHRSWYGDWNLAEEDVAVRQRTKDFVEAWCTISAGRDLMHPYEGVMERVMDEDKNDTEAVIAVLRVKPDASVAQIDFMLEGGLPAIADGAL